MEVDLLAAASPAYAAGEVVGRLLFPVLGAVLLFVGLRRRGDSTPRRGTGSIVAGSVLLALGVLGVLAAVTAGTST